MSRSDDSSDLSSNVSSSDDDSSSSGTSSSSSSESSSDDSREEHGHQHQQHGGGGGGPVIQPEQYKAAANQPIPIGSNRSAADIFKQLAATPPADHKGIHYFNAGVSLFLNSLKTDYNDQMKKWRKKGKNMSNFLWKNDGTLAESFAIACDQLKKVTALLRPTPSVPHVKVMQQGFVQYLQAKSGVPENVLDQKKYLVKLKDWEKGGTRYSSNKDEGDVTNVKFAGVLEREKKLMQWITEKRADAKSSSSTVTTTTLEGTAVAVAAAAAAGGGAGGDQLPTTVVPAAPVLDPIIQKVRAKVLSAFPALRGGNPLVAEDLHQMPMYVAFCDQLSDRYEAGLCNMLLNGITRATGRVQQAFEAEGGIVIVTRWVAAAVKAGNNEHAYRLLEALLGWHCRVSERTQAAWMQLDEKLAAAWTAPSDSGGGDESSGGSGGFAEDLRKRVAVKLGGSKAKDHAKTFTPIPLADLNELLDTPGVEVTFVVDRSSASGTKAGSIGGGGGRYGAAGKQPASSSRLTSTLSAQLGSEPRSDLLHINTMPVYQVNCTCEEPNATIADGTVGDVASSKKAEPRRTMRDVLPEHLWIGC